MTRIGQTAGPPKGGKRPFSYSEDADEAPKALDEEPVDIEESTPADKRGSVEGVESEDDAEPPVFEQ